MYNYQKENEQKYDDVWTALVWSFINNGSKNPTL